jgi:hypothetical protein
MSEENVPHEVRKIEGFVRVQITEPSEDGEQKLVGDTGWQGPNQVTNNGFLEYLVHNLGKSAGSKQIGYMALGAGSTVQATDNTLASEFLSSTKKKAVTYGAVNSTTAQFTATFGSSDSFVTAQSTLQNIGLFDTSTAAATLFAGTVFTSSTVDTNQDVNCTYQIRFS